MSMEFYDDANFVQGDCVAPRLVKRNPEGFAHKFAEGSVALENLLKNFWDHGIETSACCSGCHGFDYEEEMMVQRAFSKYLNANTISKLFMKKSDYVPAYRGYVAVEAATLKDPDRFVSDMERAMKDFKCEGDFFVRQWKQKVTGRKLIALYIDVDKNQECTYEQLKSMTPEEASRVFHGDKPDTLDKYFSAISSAVEEHCRQVGQEKGHLAPLLEEAALRERLKNPSPAERELSALAKDPLYLKNIEKQTPEMCLCAVHSNGNALEFVINQTPQICMFAVQERGSALQFAKEQTPAICLAAVRNDPNAIKFVRDQTEDLCLQAVKYDSFALKHIRNPSLNVCKEAVRKNCHAVNLVPKQFMGHFSDALTKSNEIKQRMQMRQSEFRDISR